MKSRAQLGTGTHEALRPACPTSSVAYRKPSYCRDRMICSYACVTMSQFRRIYLSRCWDDSIHETRLEDIALKLVRKSNNAYSLNTH